MHVIAETNIHLHVDDRLIQHCLYCQLSSLVFVSLANRIDAQRMAVKDYSVLGGFKPADCAKKISYGCDIKLAMAKQIEILSRSAGKFGPSHEEHGSLQYVAFYRAGLAEAKQKSFYRVSRENSLEVIAVLAGVIE